MGKWKLYTPEGFQDILYDECCIKRSIEVKTRKLFAAAGYYEIETPMLEFYDTFSMEKEFSPQESAFKLFDNQGRILVVRPDMTIPVARIMATKLKESVIPVRISYIGNTLRTDELGGGKQYEFTQAGLEIIGEAGAEADAEVLAMAVKTLLETGLEDFQIEIGQVEFFKGILDELGLDDEGKETMRKLVDKKDYIGIENLISGCDIDGELQDFVKTLPDQFGEAELIDKVQKIVKNKRSLEALRNLKEIFEVLKDYNIDKYITIDLGLVRGLEYYTGLIFRGYTYGVGFPIISGGRYDELIGKYGTEMPAVGFSAGINLLMKALDRQDIAYDCQKTDAIVGFSEGTRRTGIFITDALRKQGLSIMLDISKNDKEKLKTMAMKRGIGGIIWIVDNKNVIACDLEKNTENSISIDELLGREK